MVEEALLLTQGGSSVNDLKVGKVLDFFGVCWSAQSPSSLLATNASNTTASRLRIFCSAATFLDLLTKLETSPEAMRQWHDKVHSAFVYSDQDHIAVTKLVSRLNGEPATMETVAGSGDRYFVVADDPELCGVMAGVQIKAAPSPGAVLAAAVSGSMKSIVSLGQHAVCIYRQYQQVPLFVSTSGEVVDVDEQLLDGIFDIREHVLPALPIVLYVKWALKSCCWQAAETNACLIIDDPLLKRSHGFVDFTELLSLTKTHRFSVNIAFIPWNWRRSDPEVVRLFLDNPDHYSISIHGCDHTRAEFGNGSTRELSAKVRRALARMAAHQNDTGIHHDRVMIFPQGVFSAAAMTALRHSEFIAAVNNDTINSDSPPLRITIADVWDVAVMKYANFPLFTRRYPWEGIENFAFDALIGKPVIIVIHHDSCRDHCHHLVEFIDQLNASHVAPLWRNLGEVVRRSYRQRRLTNDVMEVEMYASQLRLENRSNQDQSFFVKGRVSNASSVKALRVGPQSVAGKTTDGAISFSTVLKAGENTLAEISFKEFEDNQDEREGAWRQARVMLRRYLCEVRDNYVTKGKLIFASAVGRKDDGWT